jgi:peptidoglycan-N-acetylglucosamine deacetylase
MRATLAAIVLFVATATQAHASRMAITVDDLPGAPHNLAAIRDALTQHGVFDTYGFVNGARGGDSADNQASMRDWLGAGHLLGNHSWSHGSLSDMGLDKYLADIARNEPLLQSLTGDDTSWRMFRYPFLVEGTSPSSRYAIIDYLNKRHYHVAQVTVDFYDWAFDDAYNRCGAKGDDFARQALRERYLHDAAAYLRWGDAASEALFGYAMPHILLIHARTMTADIIDALLTQYEDVGVQFVSLDEALADPAYKADVHHALGGSFLRQLMRAHPGTIRAPFPPHPTSWMDSLCR